jgi:hypothetical protein
METTMETVRQIVCRRDGISNEDFDDLLAEFADNLSDDPEEDIGQVFGLEPDYLFDPEIWAAIERSR